MPARDHGAWEEWPGKVARSIGRADVQSTEPDSRSFGVVISRLRPFTFTEEGTYRLAAKPEGGLFRTLYSFDVRVVPTRPEV